MYTINDLNSIMEQVNNHYQTLLSCYKGEVEDFGSVKDDTVSRFNALMFSINKACEVLNKGLDGEF